MRFSLQSLPLHEKGEWLKRAFEGIIKKGENIYSKERLLIVYL